MADEPDSADTPVTVIVGDTPPDDAPPPGDTHVIVVDVDTPPTDTAPPDTDFEVERALDIERRFTSLEDRLSALSEQIATALTAQVAEVMEPEPEPEPVEIPVDEPPKHPQHWFFKGWDQWFGNR